MASSSSLSLTGKQALLQELNVTPVTVFLTPKRMDPQPNAPADKLRNPANRTLSNDSRRSSFSAMPFRPRISSQNTSTGDVHSVTELRRKLKRLDEPRTNPKDLHMTSTPTTRSADLDHNSNSEVYKQTAPSNASVPSTLPDKSNGLLHGRSRLSFGRESAKTAPAVSATTEVAVGQLELATALGQMDGAVSVSGMNTPRQPSREVHPPPIDPSQPFVSTYEGHDPNVLALLERTYADNAVAGLHHLGPIADRAQEPRRTVTNRTRQVSSRPGDQPASLIAHLSTHQSPIIRLIASPDFLYLLSVESDGLICVWDVARFERSVTAKPRSTLLLEDGKVTAVCSLKGRSAFALAQSNGIIQLVRVGHASSSSLKQARVVPVQRLAFPSDAGNVVFLENVQQGGFGYTDATGIPSIDLSHLVPVGEDSDLLYVTSLGQISLMNIRSSALKWTSSHPISLGRVTTSHLDSRQIWLVTGTTSGYLALWDLRYGLMIRHWRIAKTGISTIAGHPARGNGKWVIVASEGERGAQSPEQHYTLMTSIDLSNGEVVERFQTSTSAVGVTSEAAGPLSFLDTPAEAKTAAQTIKELVDCNTPTSQQLSESRHSDWLPASTVRAIHVMDTSKDSALPGIADLSPVQESFDGNTGNDKTSFTPVEQGVSGIILTASSDRIIRLWNLGRPSESLVVSGAGKEANKRFK
jgi:phosphoinositide-3-kinase regulatory subunit 4